MKSLISFIGESIDGINISDDIKNWISKFDLESQSKKYTKIPKIKIKKNEVSAKILYPRINGGYKLKDLFDVPFKIKNIDHLELYYGGNWGCLDIDNANEYKYFPQSIKELTLNFFKKSLDFDFDNLISNLPNLNTLNLVEINSSDEEYIFLDIVAPKSYLEKFSIMTSKSSLINIDSIDGLNCDTFIIDTFTNKNEKEFFWNHKGNEPKINENIKDEFNETLDRFFKKNKVKNFIIGDNKSFYKVIKNNNEYKFEKTTI